MKLRKMKNKRRKDLLKNAKAENYKERNLATTLKRNCMEWKLNVSLWNLKMCSQSSPWLLPPLMWCPIPSCLHFAHQVMSPLSPLRDVSTLPIVWCFFLCPLCGVSTCLHCPLGVVLSYSTEFTTPWLNYMWLVVKSHGKTQLRW